MLIADQLGKENSDIFGQGILEIGKGKVSEKSGNFTFCSLWEPCLTLYLETPFSFFAYRADLDQAALVKAV